MAHSPETKAAALSALLAGQGVNQVAREFGLPKSVVSTWKTELTGQELEQIRTAKKERLTDLIEAHLIASLKGAIKVAGQADNDNWRDTQTASDLAIFYGVLSDKAFRLVEVAGRVFANSDGERPA